MASFDIFATYDYLMTEKADPRSKNLLLMGSAVPILLLMVAYIFCVKILGPKLMENRKPFEIDRILIAYNLFQMFANAYISYQCYSVIFRKFNLYCNEIDYSDDPDSVQLLNASHNYFLTKIIDLLDTAFFVMRKKNNQITFLHVYHHAIMLFLTWLGPKYIGGGQTMHTIGINAVVHVIMYGYYMVTVWNKELRKNHTIKRRITEIQLIQFFYGFCLILITMLNACNFPRPYLYIGFVQALMFMWMFSNFYYQAYLKKKDDTKHHVN